MDKKAVTLQQMEEALRDLSRWIRDKFTGYIAEPEEEGDGGYVLTTDGAGGRSWEKAKTEDGVWLPSVSEDGVLSWTKSAEENTPKAQNIQGPQGEPGPAGPQGERGRDGSAVYNLLDNSDFAKPVNQRGETSYSAVGYTIDRWRFTNANAVLTVQDGNVRLAASTENGYLRQTLPKALAGDRVYTFAICVRGSGSGYIGLYGSGELGTVLGGSGKSFEISAEWQVVYTTCFHAAADVVTIRCDAGADMELCWAALYEGGFTADTLPEYQPKGYGAELLECYRYFYRTATAPHFVGYTPATTTNAYVQLHLPVPMRAAPSISAKNNGGTFYCRTINGAINGTFTAIDRTVDSVVILRLALDSTNTANSPLAGYCSAIMDFIADL